MAARCKKVVDDANNDVITDRQRRRGVDGRNWLRVEATEVSTPPCKEWESLEIVVRDGEPARGKCEGNTVLKTEVLIEGTASRDDNRQVGKRVPPDDEARAS